MTLAPGAQIGPYRVISLLGEGGMGQVYRARDTKLERDVALKILTNPIAQDADRLARFQREARTLAALNHPHIAQIYGFEESHGEPMLVGLVMELVEGEDLSPRIARGALPIDEALAIARQVAEALEAAHDQGIIHRDLKPANIKIRSDGTVKVLDFGLAKLAERSADGHNVPALSIAPTIASPTVTASGMILGTAAYMSPEQARGKPVDKRADIWAFGCLLYEMITGRRPFDGDDIASAIGATIHKEPEWKELPPETPSALRATIERCLQKDPKQRARDIGDVRLAMDGAFSARPSSEPVVRAPRRGAVVRTAAIAAAAAAIIAGAAVWVVSRPVPVPQSALTFDVFPSDGLRFGNFFAVSPDGRNIAHLVTDGRGRPTLWIRSLETGVSRELTRAGSFNSSMIWSPDARFLAFNGPSGFTRIDIAGGPPEVLATVPGWAGGDWAADDTILYGSVSSGISRIPAKGGTPVTLTVVDQARQETGHLNPIMLPDGRHFLYMRVSSDPANTGIFVGSLDAKPEDQSRERLIASSENAIFLRPTAASPAGHLLYLRDGALMAQPFDDRTLTLQGDPVRIADDVGTGPATYAHMSVSSTGLLAYAKTPAAIGGTPTWLDRSGNEVGSIGGAAAEHSTYPRISPDGKRVALTVNGDLWVFELDGRPPTRLTHLDRVGTNFSALWTPDGRSIVYEPAGSTALSEVATDGSSSAPLTVSPPGHFHPQGWSADATQILASRLDPVSTSRNAWDIVLVPLGTTGNPAPVVATPAVEGLNGAMLSPNKRFLAYTSDSTGTTEIWVRPFPGPGAAERVSPDGGVEPAWSASGTELIYLEGNKFMTVKTKTDGAFSFSAPTLLFEKVVARATQPPTYDIASDGRLLVLKDVPAPPTPITVMVNWAELLTTVR